MSTTFFRGENPLKADKLNTAFSERVSRGGDTMQGRLNLVGDPVVPLEAATKQYVDRFTSVGVPTGAYIGSAPPGNVIAPLWWDTVSGQLFIQYNDGSSTQWVSANSIDASTLEGSFLPITGGTVTGPLNYTATGGTVARSAQDRSADVANVLDFGADPTGVADSSAAINAAAAVVGPNGRHKTVYLPTGTYRVNHQINLTASQGLVGDTRGASILYVDQAFSPTDTAVIFITAPFYDAGPVLRDFGITFQQPQDQTSRANFKTLAAGGTSGPGGTGVKYPWAIASGTDSFRIQCIRLRIGGAWDGITSNNHNTVFWLDDIEMGALDCGISLGEGVTGGIQDFVHMTAYHFWNFEISGALFTNVFADGQTIALRVGRADGLDIRAFNTLMGRLVVTSEAAGFTGIQIANCVMDTHQATIEVNGDMSQFSIANLSGSAGATRFRPLVTLNAACNFNVVNHYSHSSAAYPDFLLKHDAATMTISNFRSLFYTQDVAWAEVQNGLLRIVHGSLFTVGPRTVAAIAETSNGRLVVDNIVVSAGGGSTVGPLVSVVTNNSQSMIGRIDLDVGAAWTFSLPPGLDQTFYSPVTTFQNGNVFASNFYATGLVQAGLPTAGKNGTVAIFGAAGEQKALTYYRGANPGWAMIAQGAGDDLIIGRWNDAGVYQGNPVSINRLTGVTSIPSILNIPANDGQSMQTGSSSFNSFGATAHLSTAYGANALGQQQDGGKNNTALGAYSGYGITTGTENTTIGVSSGQNGPLTGGANTLIGSTTGYSITTGKNNTIVGQYADQAVLTTGSNNILLGQAVGIASATVSNTMNLGKVINSTGIDVPSTSVTTMAGSFVIAGNVGFYNTAAITKRTGYGAPTGTATRATFATGSVTLPVLAEHVKALIDDLTAYGLIGA